MTISPPTQRHSPADLGRDDAALWTDDDVAIYLRLDINDVDAAVTSGVPCLYVAAARRFVPSAVRDHCSRRSISVVMPPAPPRTKRPTTVRTKLPVHRGSGRLVQP